MVERWVWRRWRDLRIRKKLCAEVKAAWARLRRRPGALIHNGFFPGTRMPRLWDVALHVHVDGVLVGSMAADITRTSFFPLVEGKHLICVVMTVGSTEVGHASTHVIASTNAPVMLRCRPERGKRWIDKNAPLRHIDVSGD